MTRVLVYEDDNVRVYDVYDADDNWVGTDEESKLPPEPCGACGRPF